MKKKSNVQKMRELESGKRISFPIAKLLGIRNTVSVLNAQHKNEGKRWIAQSNPEKGTVVVVRVS